MSILNHNSNYPIDYFTYTSSSCSNHFSLETPLASPIVSPGEETPSDPCHPLLAYRDIESTFLSHSPRMAANVLQLQTNAAHAKHNTSRPSARPTQNVLQVSGDGYSSASGSDSSSSNVRASSNEYARCSRCQRTPSIDVCTGQWNMIQYGLNLWYCNRCAAMVGLPKR